jgi:hypothetical protein
MILKDALKQVALRACNFVGAAASNGQVKASKSFSQVAEGFET